MKKHKSDIPAMFLRPPAPFASRRRTIQSASKQVVMPVLVPGIGDGLQLVLKTGICSAFAGGLELGVNRGLWTRFPALKIKINYKKIYNVF